MGNIPFEVLINASFLDRYAKEEELLIINDFEDGQWRYTPFLDYAIDSLQYTALSAEEREALIEKPRSKLAKP